MKHEVNENLLKMRHSAAHVMAAAVCRVFDQVQLDIGPAVDNGFYYDFDLAHRLAPEDFARIEEEMGRIVKARLPFERFELARDEARRLLEERAQRFKLERLADIPEGETISFYRIGEFVDLCRGPHVADTGAVANFKLMSVAGSYYRGRETNPMLQRLYGAAFLTPKDLAVHLRQIEEARKRDHRKLGKELDLFSIQEDVGPGLVHWHPKGARIRAIIEDFWRREHFKGGYELLYTPHIGRAHLWETSGHLGFYRASMYAPMEIDEAQYFIKPMNCPFQIQIYKAQKRSYRELPLRWAELGTVYRYEKAGVLHGLLRVRGFTQDDAHIICTPDQVAAEIRRALTFAIDMWRTFGFTDISAFLATRPAEAVGDEARWQLATRALEDALQAENLAFDVDTGGGAFYGPKIDLKVKDTIGREWQVSTIQFDFNLPERFAMTYIGEDGQEHQPYMIHRALLGSLERFFGILIEHYAGAFPLWLAPEQVRVLPLTEKQQPYAAQVADELRAADLRVTVDTRQDKIGAKIRAAQVQQVPYMLILGPQEEAGHVVALRHRRAGDQGAMPLADAIQRLRAETEAKAVDPVAVKP